jgi:hypothetical protein
VKRVAFLLFAICAACKPSQQQQPSKPAAAEPQLRATVVTIRTAVEPEKKTFTHTIVIAGDRARSTGEHETWRLYDTKAETVTFVDDVEKTTRTEPLKSIVARRTATMRAPLPAHYARAELRRTKERKPLLGVSAEKMVIESGAYKRELWIGEHPSIPRNLFAMMHASEPLTTPLAPMMRTVDEALLATRGFPLADRTTVPSGEGNVIVERTVTGVAPQQVAQTIVALPKGYRDVTPKPPATTPAKKAK